MKITEELFKKIAETSIQIRNKFEIEIGYSSPFGALIGKDSDFILYETCEGIDVVTHELINPEYYILEYSEAEHLESGVFSALTNDLNEQTERITEFLIDFHQWMKSGEIKIEEYRQFKNYKWRPAGDGRFDIEKDNGNGWKSSYMSHLDEIRDVDIREHISSIYMGE